MSAQSTDSHDPVSTAEQTASGLQTMRYFIFGLVATLSISMGLITVNTLFGYNPGVESFLQDLLPPQNAQSPCCSRCASSGHSPCGCSHSLMSAILSWPNRSCGWPPSYICASCQNMAGHTPGYVLYNSAR